MSQSSSIASASTRVDLGPGTRSADGSWRMFIDGKWTDSDGGHRLDVSNPATGAVFETVALASPQDVDAAVGAAAEAFRNGPWRRTSAGSRASLLLHASRLLAERADEIAVVETLGNGMPLRESRAMVKRCVAILEFCSGVAQRAYGQSIPVPQRYVDFTLREPVGVCALIVPWNGPLISALNKVAPAIALGNTAVLKPSELTPLTALMLAHIFDAAGLPPGVLNIVIGGASIGESLVAHPLVNKIAFTGSTTVGKRIMELAARHVKRVTLELGGKSPNIVFGDVDVSEAVAGAASALLRNCGQTCIAGARMFVHRSLHDEFLERTVGALPQIRVGNGLRPETQLGPIVSDVQLARVQAFVQAARHDALEVHGAGVLRDGEFAGGSFMAPGIITGASNSMRINQDEIFGPVGVVMPFDEEDEVVALANDTSYGLAAGVWTRDIKRALRVSREIRAGTVWINTYGWNFTEAPMGGYKESGIGRENGDAVIDIYTETKNVVIETAEHGALDIFGLGTGARE